MNLDVAAQLVGLSRKTLDDYYAQLRKAQQYGFDFEVNATEKMGSLRKYVKHMSENNINPMDSPSDSIDNEEKGHQKKHIIFNTPQLKPTQSSDVSGHDLAMSSG